VFIRPRGAVIELVPSFLAGIYDPIKQLVDFCGAEKSVAWGGFRVLSKL
jgi:hypothetical protein